MKTLTNLAVSNNKINKVRSILIIISIMLTTLLLTVIATWGYGIIKTSKDNADILYGSYYGSFSNVNESQLKEMKLRSEFTHIGKMAYTAEVENKKDMFLYLADDVTRRLTNMDTLIQDGTYPEKEEELAGSTLFFKNMGYPNPQVGDRITLNYRTGQGSKYVSREFVISAILKENNSSSLKQMIGYVSEKMYNQLREEGQRQYKIYFRLDESIAINNETAEEVLGNLAEKCGIDKDRVSVNTYYIMWAFNPGIETISVCSVLTLFVIIFSVMVIYNIFQVGIKQKIWEYGKIKVLGATKKQLKSVILKEGMSLAIVAIPVGLILGYLVSVISFQGLMNQIKSMRGDYTIDSIALFNAPLLIIVILLSFGTVWLALQKPMKIISSVSMIEAMRYQEGGKKQKGIRRGKSSLSVTGMTLANLAANKKSTVATILTMGLSCVLFVVMANFVGNMDEEYAARREVEYGRFFIGLDYSLSDTAYPENNLDSILKANPLNDELMKKIEALDGVTNVRVRKILTAKIKDELVSVAVLNREDFQKYSKHGSSIGSFDYDKASKDHAVFFGWAYFLKDYGYSLNQNVTMELDDGNHKLELQGPLQGSFGSINSDWAITEDTFQKLKLGGQLIGSMWIDCKQKDVKLVQSELDELLSDVEHIEMSTYEDALQTTRFSMNTMKLGVYTFLLIIGLIGFMNMANTMITSIITRKQEFGVLQAVGMTNKQLNQMLQMEGLIFIMGTVLVSALTGIPIGYRLFCYGKHNGLIGMNIYHFPILEIGIMVVILFFLQITLSLILSRHMKKDSLVERIRYQG